MACGLAACIRRRVIQAITPLRGARAGSRIDRFEASRGGWPEVVEIRKTTGFHHHITGVNSQRGQRLLAVSNGCVSLHELRARRAAHEYNGGQVRVSRTVCKVVEQTIKYLESANGYRR